MLTATLPQTNTTVFRGIPPVNPSPMTPPFRLLLKAALLRSPRSITDAATRVSVLTGHPMSQATMSRYLAGTREPESPEQAQDILDALAAETDAGAASVMAIFRRDLNLRLDRLAEAVALLQAEAARGSIAPAEAAEARQVLAQAELHGTVTPPARGATARRPARRP